MEVPENFTGTWTEETWTHTKVTHHNLECWLFFCFIIDMPIKKRELKFLMTLEKFVMKMRYILAKLALATLVNINRKEPYTWTNQKGL